MTRIMLRAVNELKSDIAVDKHLETTSTANYSKRAYRIKNACMQNMSLINIIIYNSTSSLPVQLRACQSKNLIQQSQTQAENGC